MRSRVEAEHFTVRKLALNEALAHGHRLRKIYRDAVMKAGPQCYTRSQVKAWAHTAEELDRWDAWMQQGVTWVAAPDDAAHHLVGVAMMWPVDHVHLLYVDPKFHRRGIASALLAAVELAARAASVDALTTHASLVAHPVFVESDWTVVAWENAEHRGAKFSRARMRKVLR